MNTSPWISVKDRLPKNDRLVLLGFDTAASRIVGRYTKDGWVDHPTRAFRCPTHWMPLPDPPKPEDPFKSWWDSLPKYRDINGCEIPLGIIGEYVRDMKSARFIWNAAIASQKSDKQQP